MSLIKNRKRAGVQRNDLAAWLAPSAACLLGLGLPACAAAQAGTAGADKPKSEAAVSEVRAQGERETGSRPGVSVAAGDSAASGAKQQGAASELPEVRIRGAADVPTYRPPKPNTGSKLGAELLEIPQAINVVGPQVLIDQQARSLDDVLKNVSGITIGNNFGHTRDAHLVRGFGGGFFGSSGLVLRDGVRSMASRNVSVTTERVEVLKGPASLFYGILDAGGVINVVSKKPLQESFTQGALVGNSFGGGSGWVDVSRPLNEVTSFRVIGEHERSDYWRNFGQTRRTLIAPSLAHRAGSLNLEANYEYLDFDIPFDRGTVFFNGRPLPVPIERRFGEPYERMQGVAHLLQAQAQYELSPALKLRGTVGWSSEINSDRRAMVVAPSSGLGTTGIITRSIQGADDRERSVQLASADARTRFELGPSSHQLLVGADYEKVVNDDPSFFRRRGVTGFNIFDPVYGQLPLPTNLRDGDTVFWQTTQSRAESFGLFVQDSISFGPTWTALIGLRGQRTRQYGDNQNNLAAIPVPVVLDDQTNKVLLPNLGLVHRTLPWLSTYFNHSRSFRPNSTSASAPGPFEPERGVVNEVGLKLDHPDGLAGTIALYEIVKENVLVSDAGTSRAVGEARSRGVEIDVSGRLTRGLEIIGTYAFTDAVVTRDRSIIVGKRLPGVARHVVSLYGKYSSGAWSIGGGARYTGPRATDPSNSFDLDAYTVADVHAAHEWKARGGLAAIRLSVKNLFDKVYYPNAIAGPINLTGGGSTFIGEPRQALLQVSYTY